MGRSSTVQAVIPSQNLPGRYSDLDDDKLRGGYYTSPTVAKWLCSWAIRSEKDRVLEPSSGGGAFLNAAASRLLELGASQAAVSKNLTGVEIISEEANLSTIQLSELLGSKGKNVVRTSDFFSWWQDREWSAFDAVVGNPPFIRYQSFPEPHRTLAMEIMGEQGLSPNRLTNIWVPFVVAAVASLKKGGRLALVLPAELLQVTYAAQLRSFLTDNFSRIDIMACNELFFEKAEQEVVLLLADGALGKTQADNKCRVAMTEADTVSEIVGKRPELVLKKAQPKTIQHDNEKWLKYFLSEPEIEFMRELRVSGAATPLSTHAEVDVGVVTGKNEFFVLTNEQVAELNLDGFTIPLISRSAHLRGAKVGKADWKALSAAGDRVHLLDLNSVPDSKLPKQLVQYIKDAEKKLIHKGYKCSIRTPWYAVPSIWVPDGFLFRQIYDFPRMVLNSSGATSTDTIHRVTGKTEKPERIIANTYTWLSAASAEIEGRSYGGGVLELEPTEAERMLMPASLNGALPVSECDRLTRAGRLDEVLEENARLILMKHMGLTKAESHVLRDIWVKMRDRRMARRPKARKRAVEI